MMQGQKVSGARGFVFPYAKQSRGGSLGRCSRAEMSPVHSVTVLLVSSPSSCQSPRRLGLPGAQLLSRTRSRKNWEGLQWALYHGGDSLSLRPLRLPALA